MLANRAVIVIPWFVRMYVEISPVEVDDHGKTNYTIYISVYLAQYDIFTIGVAPISQLRTCVIKK